MKKIVILLFILYSVSSLYGQNIVKGEYFFNTDPGFNKGYTISITPGESIDSEINIVFPSDLPFGYNTLYLRFQNENNVWSHKLAKSIYVDSKSPVNSQAMVRGEYFFNTDPGYNKGTAISVKPGDMASDIDIELPADLPFGFNMLYIRFIDENGVWSQKLPKAIYLDKESDSKITEIEYYFSSKTGDSPHYTFDDFEPAPVIDFSESDFLANTSLLEYGKHYTLFARALNSDGKYSPYSSTSFTFKKLVTALDDVLGQDESFTIYPNPVQDFIYLKGGKELESNQVNFAVYDQSGKMLLSDILQDPQINVSSLKAGQYYIVIYYDKNVFGKNFIKR
jgi:hypothetical protein